MIVDSAVYQRGARLPGEVALEQALADGRSDEDRFAWIGLVEPDERELDAITVELGLPALAVEDAVHAHQRAKLEVYGDILFVVLKPARYSDGDERVELGEIMLFVGAGFVVTVRHGRNDVLAEVRATIESAPEELGCGPAGVLHAVLDRVVDDYEVVLSGLDQDIDEIELQVFAEAGIDHAERIYRLKRQVLEFRQAVAPLATPLEQLVAGRLGRLPQLSELPLEYFRDVQDHVLRVVDRVEALGALLDGALSANLAQVGVRQNEDMRKISAWVAIAGVSTLIAGVYGMNFEHMPELGWVFGYPFALLLMVGSSLYLYLLFRRRDWL